MQKNLHDTVRGSEAIDGLNGSPLLIFQERNKVIHGTCREHAHLLVLDVHNGR